MVILAVATVAVAVLHMLRGSVSLQNPFALSGLLPMLDADGILARFLGTVSASTIWEVIVVAIGLGVLYRRKATGIAIGLLTVYGLVGVVRVAVSSFFGA
jgi:hypothetical protein